MQTPAAAVSSGVCILVFLAPAVRPGHADPYVPRGATAVTAGRGRAWLVPGGTALVIEAAEGKGRDLVIGASGLSRAALVSLVSSGLAAA